MFRQKYYTIINLKGVIIKIMSKSKKKRNKPYQGPEAAHGPVVHRYVVEVKSPLQGAAISFVVL